ncbi:MAG: patatin-like phospholipase family protein [Candidatus Binatia bacterium]
METQPLADRAQQLTVDHLMASSAIPIFFPSIRIDGRHFGDGCIRNTAPLSPAINLGADEHGNRNAYDHADAGGFRDRDPDRDRGCPRRAKRRPRARPRLRRRHRPRLRRSTRPRRRHRRAAESAAAIATATACAVPRTSPASSRS